MKIFFFIALSLTLVAYLEAKECRFCAVGHSTNNACTCSVSPKRTIRVACGPACTQLAYCCDPPQCPDCGAGTPTSDSTCTCVAPKYQRLIKYACGPACTAAGYCCTLWVKKLLEIKKYFVKFELHCGSSWTIRWLHMPTLFPQLPTIKLDWGRIDLTDIFALRLWLPKRCQ